MRQLWSPGFLYFRIARKSTTLSKGCYFSNFQNCHNCDNCCYRDSSLFFPQLPQLQQLLSSGVNCIFFRIAIIAAIVMKRDPYIFCVQNCHNCDNCDEKGSVYFFVFKIAIIATIDVTRIFQNCHNCDNCCHRDSYLFFFHNCHNCNNCVIRSQLYPLFQNCHNCNNYALEGSIYILFSKLP